MVFLTNEGASSSSSTRRWKYDVFLSFRGEDTREGFTTYLYKTLEQKGINTFMDDKLPRGEEISAELHKTIEESMILVIVFSKNYAESKWCLNELVKIVECRENDQMLLPIFYNVKPREVRHQLGKFGLALANLEKEFKDNMGKMPRWREALNKAASVSGWHYEKGHTTYKSEYDFIQGIVKEISSAKFNRRPLYDAENLVGIDSRVKDIMPFLNIKSNEVLILGIYGLPGVGKTTIANVVYCIIAHQFEGSCFLEKVGEKSKNCGMIQLQEKLLSRILQDNHLKVDNEFKGTNLIKETICRKKVLLVLDDVDNLEQIKKLLGKCNWFASGSVVITTTRDKHVLTTLPIDHLIYKVEGLYPREASKLFNMHAFHTNEPKEDYKKLAELIISYAKGLPLALKVMGSDLCGKSIHEWRSAFEMYKNIQHKEIQETLKISYNGLNEKEKVIFLDIACFFKGFNKNYVVKILDACDLNPDSGIGRLIDKCLITVDYNGTLRMHDLLQQMGRNIAQEESEELENRKRIWSPEDANKLLTGNKGSNKTRGIIWCEPEPIIVSLRASAFKNMENLKFLIIKNVQNSKKLKYLSNELRLFEWPEYHFPLPSKFCPQKLVGLELSNSCTTLAKLFKQGGHYKNLISINLKRCQSITRLPDLCAPNLKKLKISFCENLIEIHDSIGLLDKLTSWHLKGCTKLQILPSSLNFVVKFILKDCPRLEKFPNVHPKWECIEILDVECIRELPVNSFDRYSGSGLHFSDGEFYCYGRIVIYLDFWMEDFFPALNIIRIDNSNIVSIPECISRLSSLYRIEINNCKELREIPRLPQSIRYVDTEKCPSLLPQSSSRLLNQFGKILGILPNGDILVDLFDDSESESASKSDSEFENVCLLVPGTEIPKSLKFNHQKFGNSVSFKVGRKFPDLAVCVAFRSAEAHIRRRELFVNVSINGYKQNFRKLCTRDSYEQLWLFSESLGHLKKPNLSEQNQVEVVVEVLCVIEERICCPLYELGNHTDIIKWFGVSVECICCPQKSDITYLPLPSDRNGCGSSSALNDTELPPLQPVFPTCYGSVMDCGAFNNEGDLGNSMEPTNTGFEPGLKGFLGDLNVSLSAPNNSELLALLPGPNMDHEVSNTVNDLRLLKGIHDDGCDLSLSLNDSDERESEPPLFPDSTNGFDFSFAQPNLELGSSVSGGFHLGSSSMAHACVNDDSDFNMGPPSKKTRTS